MSLSQRVERAQREAETPSAGALVPVKPPTPPPAPTPGRSTAREELLQSIRLRLQDEVMNIYHSLRDVTEPADLHARLGQVVDEIIRTGEFAVTHDERARLIDELVGEVGGLGPLDPLLQDDTITEIMVNGPRQIYIERAGKIERVDTRFLNDEHVLRIIDRIITPIGRRIDKSSPRVDARLPDGSRVNAIIQPLSLVGPVITDPQVLRLAVHG